MPSGNNFLSTLAKDLCEKKLAGLGWVYRAWITFLLVIVYDDIAGPMCQVGKVPDANGQTD